MFAIRCIYPADDDNDNDYDAVADNVRAHQQPVAMTKGMWECGRGGGRPDFQLATAATWLLFAVLFSSSFFV